MTTQNIWLHFYMYRKKKRWCLPMHNSTLLWRWVVFTVWLLEWF